MSKQIVLFKDTTDNHKMFNETIQTTILPVFTAMTPDTLKISQTIVPPPASVIPFARNAIACISLTGASPPIETLMKLPHFYGAYLVNEALPVAYEMTWPLNTATPGGCLLTLFNRKKKLSNEQFINRWHNGHTPLSLKMHPLWNYNRNEVQEVISGTPFEGIVEEQVRTRNDLVNPVRFFGGPLMMGINMIRTLIDTKSFIDYSTMETYFAEETWIIRE